MSKTQAERIADTVVWFPSKIPMPLSSSNDIAIAATRDLIAAINNPHPASPVSLLSDSRIAALKQLAEIFQDHVAATPEADDSAELPRVCLDDTVAAPRVQFEPVTAVAEPLAPDTSSDTDTPSTYQAATRPRNRRSRTRR
jgi:hypothetical protein